MLTSSFVGSTRLSSAAARAGGASLYGARVAVSAPPAVVVAAPRIGLVVEAAHKKGSGHSKNGRDSVSKRRGIKVYGGQPVKAGGIIVRQLGTKFHPGTDVGRGTDDTLFALAEGIVVFKVTKHERSVSVVPAEKFEVPEGQRRAETSRRTKRLAQYTPRAAQREAAVAAAAAAVAVPAAP